MLTDVNVIDQATLAEVADFNIVSNGNMIIFGPAGIGKTEMGMQAAEKREKKYVYLNLSVLEAPDLVGLPMIEESAEGSKKMVSVYAPPAYIPLHDPNEEPVVLIVDELDKAKPELQNPMLELFQFRSMNGRKMNISSVIATGNLPDENAFSQPVSWALTNRCSVYNVTCAFDPWQEWAVQSQVNPLVVAFLSRNSDWLLRPNSTEDPTAYCKPSPRSWALAAKDLDLADGKSVDFQAMIVAGRVGRAAATKFKVWLEHYRFIEPYIEKLIKNGEHPSGEAIKDTARVLVCAIAGTNAIMQAIKTTPADEAAKEKQIKRVHTVTKNVSSWLRHLSPDITIAACKSVLTMSVINEHKLTKIPEFMEVFIKLRSVLKGADKI